ncbi:MAG: AMP-binding protein, partial [Gammaproteobacteria bacterium]|nr:AMP-binding protein [Gammaproteobacteria bacterium]
MMAQKSERNSSLQELADSKKIITSPADTERCRQDLREVEAALLEQTQVDECVVLARETETLDVELTAYLTAAVRLSPEQLHAVLQKQLPAHILPGAYVQISALPLTSAGRVDEAALCKLPVTDSDLSRRWEAAIQAAASCEQAVVITQEKQRRQTRLHLLDLLPDWQEAFAKEKDGSAVSKSAEAAGEALEAGKPAICHGGPVPVQPGEADTLSQALLQTARRVQGKKIFHIQSDGSEIVQSYAELLEQAECILNGLRKENLKPGDKVIFQLEHSQDILPAFWGCILGGFIPFIAAVPPNYGEASRSLDQLGGSWERLDRALLITAETLQKAMDALPRDHALQAARICLLERLREHAPDKQHHQAGPDDTAFFSSTSGSTGVPKFIPLTHRNLLSRSRGTTRHCRYSGSDAVVNWLPFEHIGAISDLHLRCIEPGCKLVYAPKAYVLGSPLRWLDLMNKYRITHGGAPNFAYALINDNLPQTLHGKWDLSCIKFLLIAGESVSLSVMETFVKKLADYGLKKTAVWPAFGMAETGSGITYFQSAEEEPWRFFSIDRASLEGELQHMPLGHPGSLVFMSLGPAIPGISIRIANNEKQIMPENRIGHFHIKGEAVFPGYYKNPQACQAVFLEDGWFDSGDMGFISDGHLVLTGRAKESIIINGANYYSSEIEATVETAEEVEVSYTAACAVHPSGSAADKLAVFFHTSVTEDIRLREVIKKIQALLTKQLGMKADYLLPVKKQDIPKTAIGKLQRSQLCKRFEAGEFKDHLKHMDILLENANTLPDWFYRKIWRRKLPLTPAPELLKEPALVFIDNAGLGDFLCGKLENCVRAEAGAAFARL